MKVIFLIISVYKTVAVELIAEEIELKIRLSPQKGTLDDHFAFASKSSFYQEFQDKIILKGSLVSRLTN